MRTINDIFIWSCFIDMVDCEIVSFQLTKVFFLLLFLNVQKGLFYVWLCVIINRLFYLFSEKKKWEQWIRCKTFVLQLICCLCTRNHLFCFTFKRKLLSSVKLWVGNEFIIGLCHKICSQNSLLRLREEQKKEREE